MIRALVVVALVAGCGGGSSTMRLLDPPPKVDDIKVIDEVTTTRNELQRDDGAVSSTTTEHERYRRTVLAVEGRLVVRVGVHYEVDETRSLGIEGQHTVEPGALAGKHYVVWRDGDAIEAEHADGSAITAAERAELNDEFRSLGTSSVGEAWVRARAWRRDELVPIPEDVLDDMGFIADQVVDATMAWTASEGAGATLRMAITLRANDGADARGTIDFRFERATGRTLEIVTKRISRGKLRGQDITQSVDQVRTLE